MKESIQPRLAKLREIMRRQGFSATIIPQSDPHMSEYLSSHWQARRFLTGFTGSAGDLVVTLDEALLWTDSRYFLQAAEQIADTEIKLMKDGLPDTPSISKWLTSNLREGERVGINGMVFSAASKEELEMNLEAFGIALDASFDPIDEVWTERPTLPEAPIFIHDIKYAGEGAKEKCARILAEVKEQKAYGVFISALDEIAWLLNIRSNDVKYNPVATAFLYLAPVGSTLLIDPIKVDSDTKAYLKSIDIATVPYSSVAEFIKALPADEKILVDKNRTSAGIIDLLGQRCVMSASVVAMPKACKNPTQLEGVRAAMQRDGVAMVKSLYEIQRRVKAGIPTTEMDVDDILRENRAKSPLFFDESFGTIAGYEAHGAIVHYEADENSNATLHPRGLLLIDSGAQYLDGTTDITRTIALSENPTAEEKRDFTLVMKGHIALGSAIFPEGTAGTQLDALARQFLWKEGISYLHGTGHGVGHFLNVHEGPQSIRLNYVPAPLTPGMITSNEPGLYREGVHGIRCENLVLTTEAMSTEFGRFYKFETLTLCPFDLSLFDTGLMTNQEIEWLNEYHARVRAKLSPDLEGEPLNWLIKNTEPLKLHKITD